eukprot:4072224-Pyramimonas_sp.AAC.1
MVICVPGTTRAAAPLIPRSDKSVWVRPTDLVTRDRHLVVLVTEDVFCVVHGLLADFAPVAPPTVEVDPTHPGTETGQED